MNRIAIIFCALIVAGTSWFVWNRQANSMMVYSGTPVSFSYPKDFSETSATKLDGNLSSIVKLKSSTTTSVIELYKETGAIIASNVTKTPFLDYLDRVVVKNQSINRKDFRQISQARIKISGHDASRLDYSYLAADNKTTLTVSFFIIPSGNDAYYLSVGSTDAEKSKKDADKIQPTIKLN